VISVSAGVVESRVTVTVWRASFPAVSVNETTSAFSPSTVALTLKSPPGGRGDVLARCDDAG
jgi:hypothetical protein